MFIEAKLKSYQIKIAFLTFRLYSSRLGRLMSRFRPFLARILNKGLSYTFIHSCQSVLYLTTFHFTNPLLFLTFHYFFFGRGFCSVSESTFGIYLGLELVLAYAGLHTYCILLIKVKIAKIKKML